MSYFPNQGQQTSALSQSIVPATDSPQFPTGNVTKKYRTNCDTLPALPDWNVTLGTGDLLLRDGNCQGASYWVLSKSPFNTGTRSVIEGTQAFDMPTEFSFGVHRSQAALNQEFAIQIVDSGTPASIPAEVAVSALLQATTTLTVTTSAPHNLAAGQAFGIYGCADSRFNYGALVVASVISATQFTATAGPGGTIPTLSASPVALGTPFIYVRRRLGGSADGTSMVFENATATNASFYVRSNSGDAAASGAASGNHSITVGTTASTQSIAGSGAYSFFPGTEFRLNLQADRVQWHGAAADGVAATSNWITRTSLCPSPDLSYKMRLEAVNNKGLTAPVGRIVSAVKVASTTATITFAEPHGCTVDDYLVGYGVRDQAATAFANLTTAAKVASIVSPTVLTIVWGSSGTATSYGGYMSRVQGGAAQNGAVAQVFQNVSITDGLLTCTGNATWAGLVIGDLVEIYGVRNNVNGASLGIDGTYKVRNLSAAVMTLEVPGQSFTPPANLASTDCGGGVIKRSDFRVSFIRGYEYLRERVEFAPRPLTDGGAAVPTNVVSMPTTTVSGTVAAAGSVAVDAAIGNPVTAGLRASNANIAAMSATGDSVGWMGTMIGAGIVKPFSIPEADWQTPANIGGIVNTTTPFQVKGGAGVGIRNYVTAVDLVSEALTNATDLRIREPDLTCSSQTIASNTLTVSATHNLSMGDAVVFTASTVTGITAGVTYYVLTTPAATTLTLTATRGGSTLTISGTAVTATFHKVLWQTRIPTTGRPAGQVLFPTPLRGSPDTVLQMQTATASGAGAVFANFQGFVAP